MAQPRNSFGGSVGFAEEVTYGTAVTPRTNWLELASLSVNRDIDYQPEGTLGRVGDLGRMDQRVFVASDNVTGDLTWNLSYDDSSMLLLKHALGAVAESGAGPFTHDFTLSTLPVGLTVEKIWNATQAEVFEGCKITDLVITAEAGALVTATATWMGETSGGIVAASTPTYSPSHEEVKYYHAGVLTFDGANYDCVTSMTLTVNSGVDVRPKLGSKFTAEPSPQSKRSVTLSIDTEWATDLLYAAFLAKTQGDVVITFTGLTGSNSMTFTLHNAFINDMDTPLDGPGIVTQTVEFKGLTDGTDLGLLISVVNANATAIVN